MRRFALAALVISFATLAAAQSASAGPDWTYRGKTGPLAWYKLNPQYSACSKGEEQSPVNIRGARLDAALKPIAFHYIGGPVTLVNTGRTVQIHVDPGSYIVADGVRYELIKADFHHPSENTIRNKYLDMEVELLHRSAEGKLAIVSVLMSEDLGFPNATLATLWQHLPMRPGQSQRITDMVDLAGLLPADPGYWTYMGSLTTPPCTQGVRWFVFEQPISISREQYNLFAALYPMNSRPTQDLHGRKILANE